MVVKDRIRKLFTNVWNVPNVLTMLRLVLIPVFVVVFWNTPAGQDRIAALIIFAAVFTIAPFLLQLQALRSISAFTVNLSYNLEPLYTITLAMLLFGEAGELSLAFWGGIALILLSVAVQTILAVRSRNKDNR